MELRRTLESRRMTRDFLADEVPTPLIDDLVGLASRAPSAGKAQGWSLLRLTGAAKADFWSLSLPNERRADFAWPGLLRAPVVMLSFADATAYLERYSEPDKAHTGLGESTDRWGAPYWTIDASMATMSLLLAAHDAGLGALFFAVFNGVDDVRRRFGVPEGQQLLGAIALGWPNGTSAVRAGRSASRPRATIADIVHDDAW